MSSSSTVKQSYTIPCSSIFRDAVLQLAERRGVNAADLARSVMLIVPEKAIEDYQDPGDPPKGDRETIVLKSGPAEGRPWRRKPRLQLRLPPGFSVVTVRKALQMAIDFDAGDVNMRVEKSDVLAAERAALEEARALKKRQAEPPVELLQSREELERLRQIVDNLAFDPLDRGVTTFNEALHVMGFPPSARPDMRAIRSKYRVLAAIHHPDSNYGSHQRMTQLNAAMEILRKHVS
ncbi:MULTISPECIES: J domain-containing protein [Thalassospira]|uniref:Molecular chaperone DnaJ n=1 Tax=Thalassospira profundimaris TaxID=502049 RepID=A0A367VIV7_9PROT|nr:MULTISPECIES: J domain-containing protein [Thalassospira]MBR9898978.1 J domain-containing protein [Rhodospirillales bacterium]MBS8275166.1 J domain-containing protein [Thalassospira tepidiphila]KZB71309.1 molecular chaperone DnaJ [Thalassospira sp. MCCC 1A01148]MBO6806355.1 J domain-containing protein [Thalassospira sp.]MBO6839123.1 J domain-containing protein [Thalassospira sp.]